MVRTTLVAFVLSIASLQAAFAQGQLRFVTLEFSPFISGKNQQVAGAARDVISEICVRAEIVCSFDVFPWRRAQELLKSGEADGLMVAGRNARREEWLNFSPPMFRTEYGFFVRSENALIYDARAQVAGYRVGVIAPSNSEVQLEALNEDLLAQGKAPVEIDGHPDDSAGMRKLAAGRLDAVYSNRERGWAIIDDKQLQGKIRYAGADKEILYYTGINKSYPNPEVVQRFFEAWKALYSEGTAQRIIEGYGLEAAAIE